MSEGGPLVSIEVARDPNKVSLGSTDTLDVSPGWCLADLQEIVGIGWRLRLRRCVCHYPMRARRRRAWATTGRATSSPSTTVTEPDSDAAMTSRAQQTCSGEGK